MEYCCARMELDLTNACDVHQDRNSCPDALIDKRRGGYGSIVRDGDGSVIEIAYRPWCGTKLPPIADIEADV